MIYLTYDEGLAIAENYGMEEEYNHNIDNGFTPFEALNDWDLL